MSPVVSVMVEDAEVTITPSMLVEGGCTVSMDGVGLILDEPTQRRLLTELMVHMRERAAQRLANGGLDAMREGGAL